MGDVPFRTTFDSIKNFDIKLKNILNWSSSKYQNISVNLYVESTKFIHERWAFVEADDDLIYDILNKITNYNRDFNNYLIERVEKRLTHSRT